MVENDKRKTLWVPLNRNSSPPYRLGYALHTLEEGDFFRRYVKNLAKD
jgi:hypothetical protein